MSSSEHYRKVARLIERDGMLCHYCGQELSWDNSSYRPDGLSVDHIIPLKKGGSSRMENLVLACRRCNGKKSTKDYDEFILTIQTNSMILFVMGLENEA